MKRKRLAVLLSLICMFASAFPVQMIIAEEISGVNSRVENERTTSSAINTSTLESLLEKAITLSDKTTTGSAIGSCSETSKLRFSVAIAEATEVLERASTQDEVNEGVQKLEVAIQVFEEAIIKSSQGDVDADGKINVADLALVSYYYQAREEDTNWDEAKRADVNKDYVVDSIDLAIVAQNVLEK